MRVRYEQYFNYVVLCLFTELVKADYNSNFHPSIKNPKQSNPDIKNGSLLMAKNVNILCWALFQDALLELSTCGKWPRACLHGGGGPQIGVVTCGGSPNLSDVTVIALKWDIIWTGGLPLLPGVSHLLLSPAKRRIPKPAKIEFFEGYSLRLIY